MSLIIWILIFILVAGIAWWAITRLIAAFGIPDPLSTIIQVVVILILLLAFLGQVGVFGGDSGLHFGRFC